MQSNLNKYKNIGFGFFLLLGVLTFSNVEANAQWRDRDDRRENRQERREERRERREDRWENNNGGYNNGGLFGKARQQGYQDGMSAGEGHGRDRQNYNPEKSSYYKKATNGYESWMRDKDSYKNAYRQAFLQGYREGYRRYSGRGNNRGGGWGW